MNPEFSEFSYGFALTHEIVNRLQRPSLTVAPSFPSLYQEGQASGGYDVRWDIPGMPLILQFKISEWMVKRTAGEWSHFREPYYRFWVRGRRYSDQHDLLIALDDGISEVYYAAPVIHQVEALNRAFIIGLVEQSSIFFRPADIGVLPTDRDHAMAFLPGRAYGYRCSDPKEVPVSGEGLSFSKILAGRFRERPLIQPEFYFQRVTELLERRGSARAHLTPEAAWGRRRDWPMAVRAGYLARTVLGAELVWVVDETRLSVEALGTLRQQQ